MSSVKELLKKRLRLKGVRGTITSIISETLFDVIESIFVAYTTKYSNEDFHKKVDENFNLIKDLIVNHRDELAHGLAIFNKLKRFIVWDRDLAVTLIVEALINTGWTVRPKDIEWIRRQVLLFERLFLK